MLWGLRSFVQVTKPELSAELPLKPDTADAQKTISLSELIEENVPSVKDGSYTLSSARLGNGHLQTMNMSAKWLDDVDQIYYGRQIIVWPQDGASITCDHVLPTPGKSPEAQQEWKDSLEYRPEEGLPRSLPRTRYLTREEISGLTSEDTKPMAIAIHGLCGGSHESYIRATLSLLASPEYGFECIALNTRGCARSKITTPMLFNAAWTTDVRRFIKDLRSRYPNRSFYLVGFSLGASTLATYLGQEGADTDIAGACIVANPWDLAQSHYELEASIMGRTVYLPAMLSNLVRMTKYHIDELSKLPQFDAAKLDGLKSVADFDNNFTAKVFGFDTALDYYRTSSSVNQLMNVHTPSLILHALDDPMAQKSALPYGEVKKNPYTYLATTSLGGHLGWFNHGSSRWFPTPIADFFKAMHDNVDSTIKSKTVIQRPQRLWAEDRFDEDLIKDIPN